MAGGPVGVVGDGDLVAVGSRAREEGEEEEGGRGGVDCRCGLELHGGFGVGQLGERKVGLEL